MKQLFDPWSTVVIVLTLVLFVLALFIKGLKHDILLEAAIFLVSMKLILMSYKNGIIAAKTEERLEQIHALLRNSQSAFLRPPLDQ